MLTTCDLTHTALGEGNAALPLIDIQPASEAMYTYGDEDIEPLTVEASSPDGGVISYQWYAFPPELPENATDDDEEPNFEAEPVPGATGTTFVPVFPSTPPESGIYSFYALVTNTNEGVVGAKTASRKSDNAVIVVYNPDDAAYPSITTNPESAEYILGPSMSVRALTVTATVDSGTLTYRWYRSPTGVNRGGLAQQALAGPDAFFTPTFTQEGTYYYYAVVTNTDSSAAGRKTTTRPSQVAVITVVAVQTAATPVITVQPQDASYAVGASAIAALTTGAEDAADGGDITWQWYKNTTSSTSGATPIDGANSPTFTPTISTAAAGTEFYYAVATNTNEYAVNKTTTAMTRIVTVSVFAPYDPNAVNATMTVDPTVKHQYVRGFGGMSPNWGNAPDDTARDIELMFNPDTGLGYNMFRIMIPPYSTDIEEGVYQLVNNRQSGDKDRSDFYELVKIVNKYNGYVLASPWTPPAEWKNNGSLRGGAGGAAAKLLPQYYGDYAEYLKAFAQHMYDKGAPIYAISIQNEPNFAADYDGCEWEAEEMRDFFKQVGRFTEGVKGWGAGKETETVLTMNGETANSVPLVNDAALNDPVSRAAIDVIGRHVYGNQVTNGYQLAIQNGKEVWMTEHNVNSGTPPTYPNDSTWNYVWAFMNDVDLVIRINSENAFIWWTSKRFYSMIGDGEYGTVDGAILPRGHGLSHYAKFARETTRIGLTASGTMNGGSPNISTTNFNQSGFALGNVQARGTAYITEDGNTISVILFTPTNNSGAQGFDLGNVKIQLPAGFNARSAVAMRTDGTGKRSEMEGVQLAADRNSALVNVPRGTILSVRFVK
jgi:O-glycosyl hydrolase